MVKAKTNLKKNTGTFLFRKGVLADFGPLPELYDSILFSRNASGKKDPPVHLVLQNYWSSEYSTQFPPLDSFVSKAIQAGPVAVLIG
ncbi:hypothetical protein KKD49_13045 [Myxococcota bacterium]|nr:hypothetical protein [Myxococcota bacterium]